MGPSLELKGIESILILTGTKMINMTLKSATFIIFTYDPVSAPKDK